MHISSSFRKFSKQNKTTYPANSSVFTVDTQYGYTHQFSVTGDNISIDWGDGTIDEMASANNATQTHTYADVQEYTIQVANATNFRHGANNNIVVSASQLGDTITSCYQAFYYCTHLTVIDSSNWNTSNVTTFAYFAKLCTSLTTLHTENWDMSNVTVLTEFINSCINLTTLDVSNWDVSNATDVKGFAYCGKSLSSLDVTRWNTANLSTCAQFVRFCTGLTVLDLSSWLIQENTNIDTIAGNCTSITEAYAIDQETCDRLNTTDKPSTWEFVVKST